MSTHLGYSTQPRYLEIEPHQQMQFTVILKTPVLEWIHSMTSSPINRAKNERTWKARKYLDIAMKLKIFRYCHETKKCGIWRWRLDPLSYWITSEETCRAKSRSPMKSPDPSGDLNYYYYFALILRSSSPGTNPLVTVPSTPIITGITVTFVFSSFFTSLARSRYVSQFSLPFSFTLWLAGTAKSTIRYVFFSFFCWLLLGLVVWPILDDAFVYYYYYYYYLLL